MLAGVPNHVPAGLFSAAADCIGSSQGKVRGQTPATSPASPRTCSAVASAPRTRGSSRRSNASYKDFLLLSGAAGGAQTFLSPDSSWQRGEHVTDGRMPALLLTTSR